MHFAKINLESWGNLEVEPVCGFPIKNDIILLFLELACTLRSQCSPGKMLKLSMAACVILISPSVKGVRSDSINLPISERGML